jgi:hypothetical protein
MFKRIMLVAFMISMAAMPAVAQTKGEVGVTIGWTFADGVSGASVTIPLGCPVGACLGTFNRVDPLDSWSWGFDVGFFVGPKAEVGFIYNQQPTKLQAGGTNNLDIGDFSAHTYHGTFTYNFGEEGARIRPYVMGGLGATSWGTVDYVTPGGVHGTLQGLSRFSTTWGAGVKAYGAGRVGARAGLRFTPAYIKSDSTGWWCDPYWGCYVVGNAQYANQFEINGGVTFRF